METPFSTKSLWEYDHQNGTQAYKAHAQAYPLLWHRLSSSGFPDLFSTEKSSPPSWYHIFFIVCQGSQHHIWFIFLVWSLHLSWLSLLLSDSIPTQLFFTLPHLSAWTLYLPPLPAPSLLALTPIGRNQLRAREEGCLLMQAIWISLSGHQAGWTKKLELPSTLGKMPGT